MATLRFSHIDREMTIPTAAGQYVGAAYNPTTRTGSLGSLASSTLGAEVRDHISAALGPAALATLANEDPTRPIIVMVHGFDYDPRLATPPKPSESDNPHDGLFSYTPISEAVAIKNHATPWPRSLGFDPQDAAGASGLAVCFGWFSVPFGADVLGAYRRAYRLSNPAADALRIVLDALHALLPNRRIRMMGHSLGSGPILKACLALAEDGDPQGTLAATERVLLLAGAEYCDVAVSLLRALDTMGLSAAGGPTFYNGASWHDNVVGGAQTAMNESPGGSSQMIGYHGLLCLTNLGARRWQNIPRERWLDVEIGSQGLSDWLEARGLPRLRRGKYYLGHWDHYVYEQNMAVWRDVLREGTVDWNLAALRAAGIPEYESKNPWA